jgi:hypothetical protein
MHAECMSRGDRGIEVIMEKAVLNFCPSVGDSVAQQLSRIEERHQDLSFF